MAVGASALASVARVCAKARTRLLLAGKLGEELLDVQRGGGAAVVVVPVHVQHLLAGDRQQAAQQALLHAGAHHDSIPLLSEG
jgi:hypothetical protein